MSSAFGFPSCVDIAPHGRRLAGFAMVAALLAFCCSICKAEPGDTFYGPEWLDPRDDVYRDIRAAAVRGELPITFWTSRATTRMELARWISGRAPHSASASRVARELAGELESLGVDASDREVSPLADWPLHPGHLRFRPYVQAAGDWREGRSTRWVDGPRLGLAGSAFLSPRWSIHEDIFVGRVPGALRFADALIAHSNLLLSMESFYAGFEGSVFRARLGRFRHQFGPGRQGDLLFSAAAAPLDQVEYSLRWPKLRFIALAGPKTVAPESNIAFHRLEWIVSEQAMLALSEGAVYPGSPAQPLYLSGLVPYTLVERLHGQDATASDGVPRVRNNVLWQFDAVLRPGRRNVVYSSLLLDDVATESSAMPTRLGFQFGWESTWGSPGAQWSAGAEALKIYQYTYSVYNETGCDCDWSHQGEALGSDEGPDVERLELFGAWSPDRDWELELSLLHRAHGAGRLGTPWYPSSVAASGANSKGSAADLSGIVEKRNGVGLKVRAIPSSALTATLRISLDRVENEGNSRSEARREVSASLRFSAHR